MRIELILPRSQHGVQTTTLRAPLIHLVPHRGNDPRTYRLSSDCSTTELMRQCLAGGIGFEPMHTGIKIRGLTTWRTSN